MDNVQKHSVCNNIPSSQTFRYYLETDSCQSKTPYFLLVVVLGT
jgi:hypothetical protein